MRFTSINKSIKYISDWGAIFLSLKEQLSPSVYNIYNRQTLYRCSNKTENIMFYSYDYNIPLRMNSKILEVFNLFDWSIKMDSNHSPQLPFFK